MHAIAVSHLKWCVSFVRELIDFHSKRNVPNHSVCQNHFSGSRFHSSIVFCRKSSNRIGFVSILATNFSRSIRSGYFNWVSWDDWTTISHFGWGRFTTRRILQAKRMQGQISCCHYCTVPGTSTSYSNFIKKSTRINDATTAWVPDFYCISSAWISIQQGRFI